MKTLHMELELLIPEKRTAFKEHGVEHAAWAAAAHAESQDTTLFAILNGEDIQYMRESLREGIGEPIAENRTTKGMVWDDLEYYMEDGREKAPFSQMTFWLLDNIAKEHRTVNGRNTWDWKDITWGTLTKEQMGMLTERLISYGKLHMCENHMARLMPDALFPDLNYQLSNLYAPAKDMRIIWWYEE